MKNLCAALLLTLTLAYSASAGVIECEAPAPASTGVMEADSPGIMQTGAPSSNELSAALLQALLTAVQSGTP